MLRMFLVEQNGGLAMTRKQAKAARAGMETKPNLDLLEASRFDIRHVPKTFRQLSVDMLRPGVFQSRRVFNAQSLKELGASMKATGINFSPLIVRPSKDGDGFEIICGERRWLAAPTAGIDMLLCCIGDFTDEQALYLCAVENIQREDLNPIEEAGAYDLLVNECGMTHQEVALEVGQSRSYITNYLRLLKLPLSVRDLVTREALSFAQVRPLCALSSPGIQVRIAAEAARKGWNVKRIEKVVAEAQNKAPKGPARRSVEDIDIKRLRELVSIQTGYPCVIIKTESGGWQLGLSSSSVDEFMGILERLGVDTDSL